MVMRKLKVWDKFDRLVFLCVVCVVTVCVSVFFRIAGLCDPSVKTCDDTTELFFALIGVCSVCVSVLLYLSFSARKRAVLLPITWLDCGAVLGRAFFEHVLLDLEAGLVAEKGPAIYRMREGEEAQRVLWLSECGANIRVYPKVVLLCHGGCRSWRNVTGALNFNLSPARFFESKEYFLRLDEEYVPLIEVRDKGRVTLVPVVLARTYWDAGVIAWSSEYEDNKMLYVHALETMVRTHPLGSHFVVASDYYHEERHAHRILGLVQSV
jgi:hypothetical protein